MATSSREIIVSSAWFSICFSIAVSPRLFGIRSW
jgi:hypothetical protein